MRTCTLQEFKDKVELEQDLQEESFISNAEMVNYVNEGIDWAESIVVGLYEDYYLDCTAWLAVAPEVSLPTYIYGNKLRKVEVADSASSLNTLRLKKNNNLSDCFVGYNIYHKQGANPVLTFENIPDQYTVYKLTFTRNANRVVNATDIVDLPEIALYYAQQFVKIRCQQKERDPQSFKSSEEIMGMEDKLTSTLSNMVNDGSDQLEPDMTFYNDFDIENYY